MEPHHHHHHHHHQQQPQHHHQHVGVSVDAGDRFPQWSIQETRDFLLIRAELDQTFMETKRNKLLWEVISNKMKEKGYVRSAEQCKCKWKNLVTRYKGCETAEAEGMRQQFPFFHELQTIFAARMQRMLWIEAEGGGGSGSKKKGVQTLSSEDEEDENEESDREKLPTSLKKNKKRKVAMPTKSGGGGNTNVNVLGASTSGGGNSVNALKEVLEEFMNQQMQMEMQWLKAYEAREEERRMKEMEWRQAMEALENERLMMDQRWREREEQRRIREEARAEKRDALVTVLLNKLRRDD